MADGPVTLAEQDEIRRLHAEGLGRNEIARRMGRGSRTISVHAARLGLEFDGSQTAEGTRVRMLQLAEKRAILADALTDDALRLSEQMWEPSAIHSFGGKDHTYASALVDEPPAADKRALMAAAAAANAAAMRLVPPEAETEGMAAVDQWLRGMMGGTPAPE
ncbi:helix-turn-helix domain-containing protein [Streptomyces sp. NPDC093801]|uniref:helix-turn-helix domain-containing protein n=1 Tax=Streptomyces sp. NPDC093801 TaxID=3155203 RepID=UPI00344FA359